jgi:6-pyruvoyl-tetrahydropterin synthase
MKIETFYDFQFRARHALPGRSETAAHPHWHSYCVRLWFLNAPDQDALSEKIEGHYEGLHGSDLGDQSTDEQLAEQFLKTWAAQGCVRARVTNDERRGAEVAI